MFDADQASQALGIEISELAPGSATVTVTVGETMVNGHGITHGGYVFCSRRRLALACNGYEDSAVAARADIRFLRPTRLGDTLTAVATEKARGGRSGIYDVTVRNGDTVVAEFRGDSRNHHPLKFSPRCFSSRRKFEGAGTVGKDCHRHTLQSPRKLMSPPVIARRTECPGSNRCTIAGIVTGTGWDGSLMRMGAISPLISEEVPSGATS
ncbi:unnamed protein product, partial [Mesorhabditis spiculigera]